VFVERAPVWKKNHIKFSFHLGLVAPQREANPPALGLSDCTKFHDFQQNFPGQVKRLVMPEFPLSPVSACHAEL